jgi:transaldolase
MLASHPGQNHPSNNLTSRKPENMSSKLEQLKAMTDVVADTGDIEAIKQFHPLDATTNPSLLLKAADLPHYADLLDQAKSWASSQGGSDREQLANCCDRFAVDVGLEILDVIPGRISTEVDARLSFDTQATLQRARKLVGLYEEAGISRERILIKIASTWEGIQAGAQLEKEGINCNLTLLFGFSQAAACADAGVFLISPFVGRILDWYKANTDLVIDSPQSDPGVQSVARIYNYYKHNGYNTVVMGASFRNAGEIEALAGCDRLTISPALLQELKDDNGVLARQLDPANANSSEQKSSPLESEFRYALNDDAMATEKLAEGIRNFVADQIKLEKLISLR